MRFNLLIDDSDDDDEEMDISDRWDDINIQADIELSGEIEIGGSYLFHKIFWMMKENLNEKEQNYVWLKGKLGENFLSAQSFYLILTKRSFNRQFLPKSPEVGQKSS